MTDRPFTSMPAAARALAGYLRPHRGLVGLLVAGLALDLAVGASLPPPNVTFALLQIGVGAAGAAKAYSGELAVGALIAFNALLLALGTALAGLTRTLPLLLLACGGVGRISALLDEPALEDTSGPANDDARPEDLRFENVSFSYGTGRQLDAVDLTIEAGTHVAFVGGSGAGPPGPARARSLPGRS